MPTDPYSYFTIWSLIISYSIFIWTVFLGVPRWLFLFAACFLTTTSVIGTFFLTLPSAKILANKFGITTQQVILEDSVIHSGPLVLFLLLFCLITKNVVPDKPIEIKGILGRNILAHSRNIFGRIFKRWTGKEFMFRDYHKVILLSVIVIFAYLGYIKFEKIYYYDYFTLVILAAAVFVTSYQIYSRLV